MFDASLLNDFDKADPVAHGLPGAVYTSAEFFRLEQEQLFAKNWVFVGYAHQLERPGDVQPIYAMSKSRFEPFITCAAIAT
jgi:hypothetical protein